MSMPSTYDTGGATTGTASEPYDRGYLFSLDSVLKITQAVSTAVVVLYLSLPRRHSLWKRTQAVDVAEHCVALVLHTKC